jgi:hypothetical protein
MDDDDVDDVDGTPPRTYRTKKKKKKKKKHGEGQILPSTTKTDQNRKLLPNS